MGSCTLDSCVRLTIIIIQSPIALRSYPFLLSKAHYVSHINIVVNTSRQKQTWQGHPPHSRHSRKFNWERRFVRYLGLWLPGPGAVGNGDEAPLVWGRSGFVAVFRATSQLRADARHSLENIGMIPLVVGSLRHRYPSPIRCLWNWARTAWEMARYRICRAGAVVEPIAHEGAELDNLNVQICTN